jgi:hypothetical protein
MRRLERALAHPWQESARFGVAYTAGVILADLIDGQPIVRSLVLYAILYPIMTLLLGLSMRGGWHHRVNQRRLDRLRALTIAPPPAWYPDPAEQHEFRFWNGLRWTDFALDNGVQCADPLPEP